MIMSDLKVLPYALPPVKIDESDNYTTVQWNVGLKVADYRRHGRDRHRGRTVIRWLDGNQEFTLQDRVEQEAYMECPSAFWLRPDGDYLSEEPYDPVRRVYHEVRDQTAEMAL